MDIHIGTWAFPALITLLSVALALYAGRNDGKAHGYAAVGAGVVALLLLLAAIIVSLIAWLVWAVLS